MTAHHRLRRLAAPVSTAVLALVVTLAACSSSGGPGRSAPSAHSAHSAHSVHLSASATYPNATAIATALHRGKVACGTPTKVTNLPAGVGSEVACAKTPFGALDVVVFSGTRIPTAWTTSYHHLCNSSSAATDYVRGKNWAIVARAPRPATAEWTSSRTA